VQTISSWHALVEILKVSYKKDQQQNKLEQEVQLDGSAGFKQHSSSMSAGVGHVWGFASAPLGEVVRRCLGPAIFPTRQYLLGSLILLL
jgi:hypothetical protein